jgi:hypothetical protein
MFNDADGIPIVLSPVQLAAVLKDDSVSNDATLQNRMWGGLKLVGGVLEITGAGVLCVLPEPTLLTKAGCVLMGAHGGDTTGTALRQIWTGQDSQSLTQSGSAALARALGASAESANNIGLTVDIAVPFAAASIVGAARVATIRSGRISLIEHEALAVRGIGGHTIAKHVGRTEAQLRARLLAETKIPVASTFTNLQVAEAAISKTLRAHGTAIKSWAQTAGPNQRLDILHDLGTSVGFGVVRSSGSRLNMSKVFVVLKMQTYNGKPYYILTAFLKP